MIPAKNDSVIVYNAKNNSYQMGTVVRVTKTQFRVQPEGTTDKDSQRVFEKCETTYLNDDHSHHRLYGNHRWTDLRCFAAGSLDHVKGLISEENTRQAERNAKLQKEREEKEAKRQAEMELVKQRVNLAFDTRMFDNVNGVINRVVDVKDENGQPYARVTITIWESPNHWNDGNEFECSYTYMKWSQPGSSCSCGTFRCVDEKEGTWEALRSALSWF